MAATTDKFRKAYNSAEPNVARVSSTRAVSATTLSCDNLTGWPTDTAVDFVTYQLDSSNEVVSGSLTVWQGVVSGNTITSLDRTSGAADAGNAINDVVEMVPTGHGLTKLVEGILVHADQDGTLKAGAVDVAAVLASDVVETAKIKDANVTTAKINDAAVTATKLSTSAITLGYAEKTSSQGSIAGSGVDITGLSVTVTVPTGGRRIKITGYVPAVSTTVSDSIFGFGIAEDSTQLNQLRVDMNRTDVSTTGGMVMWSGTPSAGSHTYKLTAVRANGTGTLTVQASATAPAFILVEAI